MPDNPGTPSEVPANTGSQTPAERLEALRSQLQKDDEELGSLTKERDALKTDVDSLAKTVDEINKSKADFAKSLETLKQDKQKVTTYHDAKAPMIDAALGPKKPGVEAKIKEVEKKISDKKTEVGGAKTAADQAVKEATEAQTDLDKKQADYDGYKNIQKDLGDKIQKINDLRAKIEKNDDPPKAATMFVYLREFKTILDDTNVPSQADFEKELIARWQKLDEAKENTRKKKLAAESAKGTLAGEQASLALLEKNRVEDLVNATKELN